MYIEARDYRSSQPMRVTIEGTRIEELIEIETDGELPWIAPGLFDLQINGYGGTWFSDENLTVDQCLEALHAHYQHGITHLFPTLITNSAEALENGFSVIRQACEQEEWADRMVLGCHLEGPYISKEDGPRGAHPLHQVRDCNWNELQRFQAASGNRIRLVTLAPESPGAVEFIRKCVANHVAISIGHTAANTEEIEAAVTAGAKLSTHLGNGAHGTLRRHPNYIWDQLGDQRLSASLIADGHHLPPSVVRSFYYAKGVNRLVLTCDASGLAGSPPGIYDFEGNQFEVLESGKVVVAGQSQYLAGSGVQTDVCVATMMQMTGCSLAEAWQMATINPARLTGVKCAALEAGQPADLVLFECHPKQGRLEVLQTISNGQVAYNRI